VHPRHHGYLGGAIVGGRGERGGGAGLGGAPHDRVQRRYLGIVRLAEYGELLDKLGAVRA
jgi:hypothetical protein